MNLWHVLSATSTILVTFSAVLSMFYGLRMLDIGENSLPFLKSDDKMSKTTTALIINFCYFHNNFRKFRTLHGICIL